MTLCSDSSLLSQGGILWMGGCVRKVAVGIFWFSFVYFIKLGRGFRFHLTSFFSVTLVLPKIDLWDNFSALPPVLCPAPLFALSTVVCPLPCSLSPPLFFAPCSLSSPCCLLPPLFSYLPLPHFSPLPHFLSSPVLFFVHTLFSTLPLFFTLPLFLPFPLFSDPSLSVILRDCSFRV